MLFEVFSLHFSKSLVNFVVHEIQPKIKVIQSAILETENAKTIITENVALIEKRLMPNIPSESEAITRVRTELLESLHKCRAKRLNAIVKRQLILKQCEKVQKKLFRIKIFSKFPIFEKFGIFQNSNFFKIPNFSKFQFFKIRFFSKFRIFSKLQIFFRNYIY